MLRDAAAPNPKNLYGPDTILTRVSMHTGKLSSLARSADYEYYIYYTGVAVPMVAVASAISSS